MDEELHSKVNRLLVMGECHSEKLDQLYKCVYIGNGEPSLKVSIDRNKQKIKLILWVVAVLFIAASGAIAANIF